MADPGEGRLRALVSPAPSRAPNATWFATSSRKRALDIVVASIGLVLASPIFVLAAIAIRLESGGGVLFRQERVGMAGRTFTCLKLRSMTSGVDDAPHRAYVGAMIVAPDEAQAMKGMYKLVDDPRVTSVGRFLRRWSFDELPQLFNVLAGDMSIVGPRPALDYEVELYQDWQRERLNVKPGITGLWQVSGRNRLTFEEQCRLDIAYTRDGSLGRDIAIILKTPAAMIRPGVAA